MIALLIKWKFFATKLPVGFFISSLLLILCSSLKTSGRITYNGHGLNEFVPQRTAAYVSQQDWHVAEMTVRETLEFAGRCQGVGFKYGKLWLPFVCMNLAYLDADFCILLLRYANWTCKKRKECWHKTWWRSWYIHEGALHLLDVCLLWHPFFFFFGR